MATPSTVEPTTTTKTWKIYPIYFDSKFTRDDGRKFPLNKCVDHPTLDEIGQALKSLQIQYQNQPQSRHPASWEHPGRVIITPPDNFSLSRYQLLQQIAAALPTIRQSKQEQASAGKKKTNKKKK
ncbi:hypothetical protein RCL1_003307 [Eukaryota sp. TZLM3-RCL]